MQEATGSGTAATEARESIKTRVDQLKGHVGDYVKTYVEIGKARAVKGASTATANMVTYLALFLFALFFLFFLAFGLGWWLGNLLDNRAAGFLAVAGLFLLMMALVYALRKRVILPMVRNMIVSKAYE